MEDKLKIEIKHFAAYLPYNLYIQSPKHWKNYGQCENVLMIGLDIDNVDSVQVLYDDNLEFFKHEEIKPILKNIKSIVSEHLKNDIISKWYEESYVNIYDEITVDIDKHSITIQVIEDDTIICCDLIYLNIANGNNPKMNNFLPYWLTQKLIENHYDIYGLIDSGLAVDYDEVKNGK